MAVDRSFPVLIPRRPSSTRVSPKIPTYLLDSCRAVLPTADCRLSIRGALPTAWLLPEMLLLLLWFPWPSRLLCSLFHDFVLLQRFLPLTLYQMVLALLPDPPIKRQPILVQNLYFFKYENTQFLHVGTTDCGLYELPLWGHFHLVSSCFLA